MQPASQPGTQTLSGQAGARRPPGTGPHSGRDWLGQAPQQGWSLPRNAVKSSKCGQQKSRFARLSARPRGASPGTRLSTRARGASPGTRLSGRTRGTRGGGEGPAGAGQPLALQKSPTENLQSGQQKHPFYPALQAAPGSLGPPPGCRARSQLHPEPGSPSEPGDPHLSTPLRNLYPEPRAHAPPHPWDYCHF